MVSVQLDVQGCVAVKVAQAFTSSSMLSAQVGAEQKARTAVRIDNLSIDNPLVSPRRLSESRFEITGAKSADSNGGRIRTCKASLLLN